MKSWPPLQKKFKTYSWPILPCSSTASSLPWRGRYTPLLSVVVLDLVGLRLRTKKMEEQWKKYNILYSFHGLWKEYMYCIPFMDPPFYDVPLTNILTMRIFIWPSSFLVPENEKQREKVSRKILSLLWLANDVFLVLKIWWANLDFT